MLPLRSATRSTDAMPAFDRAATPATAAGAPDAQAVTVPDARMTAAEYERWLLPPVPRSGAETLVHWLSLGAGVAAVVCGSGMLWALL